MKPPFPERLQIRLANLGVSSGMQTKLQATSLLSAPRIEGIVNAIEATRKVKGDTAEIGVAHGGTSLLMATLNGDRPHWACDTFAGLVDAGPHDDLTNGQFANTLERTAQVLKGRANIRLVSGYFPKSAPKEMRESTYSLVHIDVDTYQSILACFRFFSKRMAKGGLMVLDDVLARGCVGAMKAFSELGGLRIHSQTPPQAVVQF